MCFALLAEIILVLCERMRLLLYVALYKTSDSLRQGSPKLIWLDAKALPWYTQVKPPMNVSSSTDDTGADFSAEDWSALSRPGKVDKAARLQT